eukprot:4818150-Amphidinium_carterae.1
MALGFLFVQQVGACLLNLSFMFRASFRDTDIEECALHGTCPVLVCLDDQLTWGHRANRLIIHPVARNITSKCPNSQGSAHILYE